MSWTATPSRLLICPGLQAPEAAIARPDRLLELVTLLGGRRPRTLRELIEHFEISERTAYRDLAALDRRNIPP